MTIEFGVTSVSWSIRLSVRPYGRREHDLRKIEMTRELSFGVQVYWGKLKLDSY